MNDDNNINITNYININVTEFIPDFEKILNYFNNQNDYLIDLLYYWSQYDFLYKILTYGLLIFILVLSLIVIFRIRLIK